MRGPACKQCLYHLGRRGFFPDELARLEHPETFDTGAVATVARFISQPGFAKRVAGFLARLRRGKQ